MRSASSAALLALQRQVVRSAVGRRLLGDGVQRLVPAPALPLAEVAARVRHQAVEPGREPAAAAELVDPGAQLGQRLLGGVLGVLRIREQVAREPPDGRLVPLDQHLERPPVAVTRPHGQHDVRHRRVPRASHVRHLAASDAPPRVSVA